MTASIKEHIPQQWWAIAECADAYESSCGDGFPDLRSFIGRLPLADRPAALAELIKIEMERRWRLGQPKRVEDYLRDYPELGEPSPPLEELVAQESLIRSRQGAGPSVDELRGRFPSLDIGKVLPPRQDLAGTLSLGNALTDTRPAQTASQPLSHDSSGTIMYDSRRAEDSEPGAGVGGTFAQTVAPSAPNVIPTPSRAARSAAAFPTEAPVSIGRYTVREQLGAGSFGAVYRCFDEELKRDVAIKVPHQQGAPTAERVKEFIHEAQSAARLHHPGIVTVLDTSQTEDGRIYIVYEFIRGTTLQDRVDAADYTPEDVVRWIAGTADALQHAHKHGIVHRDIKPANILLDDEGKPHVADFGLAKMDDQFFKDDTGRVLGSVAYMSPEQAAGQSHWATPQTDTYSLGVMLYQLLVHRLPFSANSLSEMIEQVKQRVPPPPRAIDDKISKPLEDICLRAMAKNPADRYSTTADMAADLRRALAGKPPLSRGWTFAIGAAGAAALVLLCFFLFRPAKQDLRESGDRATLVAPSAPGPNWSIELPPATPRLVIDYQGATESGHSDPLEGKQISLHEGDKVQLHVTLVEPRFVYLYWFDVNGQPRRLWPLDAGNQHPVTAVDSPESPDDWHLIDSQRGAETALVGVREKPLSAEELARFKAQTPYSAGDIRLTTVFPIGSKDIAKVHRGLGSTVTVRKNPLSDGFQKSVSALFDSYHGEVIPHVGGVAAEPNDPKGTNRPGKLPPSHP